MGTRIQALAMMVLVAALSGCGSNSSDSGAVSASSTITLSLSMASVAAGASTTVTVSGGSGTYVSPYASEGSFYQSSGNTYVYTAPTAPLSTLVSLTISDSVGSIGTAYINIGGSSGLSVSAGTSSVAISGSTTLYVSGGSGSYTWTVASGGGTLNSYSGPSVTFYAPNYATTSYVSVSDTSGNFGSVSVYVGTSSSGATSCGGTYTTDVGGVSATMFVVQGSGNYIGGFLYMYNYYYPIIGTCSLSGGTGSISFTNVADNSPYSGTVTLSGSQLFISGTMTSSGGYGYNWTATSQNAATTFTAPANNCQGNYTAMIGPNAGQITMVHDGSGNVAGYLYLQGYIYALAGTCSSNGGVSITNYTTGSTYTGSATYNGSLVYMSGTFTTTGGVAYSWSATQQ